MVTEAINKNKEYHFLNKNRDLIFKKFNNKCCRCGSKESLMIHHLKYGTFDVNDLILVCAICHKREHGATKNFNKDYNLTQIRVSEETKEKLKKIRLVKRETYEELINRLIKCYKEDFS